MNHKSTILFAAIAALAIAFQGNAAHARRGSSNVSSRGEFSFHLESGGRILPTYQHRGYTYVEGQLGSTYAIRVYNHTNRRVEAVVTVDGRDVITGRPGNYRSARGYVIAAYSSVLIEGFRQSLSNVAAFQFTDVHDSYAARMGSATNVGVIGVAVFKERVPQRYHPPIPLVPDRRRGRMGTGYGDAESGAAKPAPSTKKESKARRSYAPESSADCLGCYDEYVPEPRQDLGTRYGYDTYSPAAETRFVRRSHGRPNATLSIYYDDREGLVSKGVLPRPYPPYPRPYEQNPFLSSPDPRFAPPPPPRRY